MKCRVDNACFALWSVTRRLKRWGVRFHADCRDNRVTVLHRDGSEAFTIAANIRGDLTFGAGPLVPRSQMLPALIAELKAAGLIDP